jgi:hypothetical protein
MQMPMTALKTLCVLLAALASAGVVAAAEKSIELFNGKSLDGWEVLKCEADVQGGAILIKAGNGMVETKDKFLDFVLDLEWKALQEKVWDSGIYFHYQEVPKKAPWPPRYQVNLANNMEGNLVGVKAATSKGLVKDHEWNHFKLTCNGTRCSLEINGKRAWEVDGVKEVRGPIGLQAEVPAGGQFLFRNIRITPLGDAR